MEVIILSCAPAALRGMLTRWFIEVSTGVYVGNVSARVREQIWQVIENRLESGKAIMINSSQNEQHLKIRSINHDWEPVELEGFTVMLQNQSGFNNQSEHQGNEKSLNTDGWSIAGRKYLYGNSAERMLGKR